jgi:hypothetical protein
VASVCFKKGILSAGGDYYEEKTGNRDAVFAIIKENRTSN